MCCHRVHKFSRHDAIQAHYISIFVVRSSWRALLSCWGLGWCRHVGWLSVCGGCFIRHFASLVIRFQTIQHGHANTYLARHSPCAGKASFKPNQAREEKRQGAFASEWQPSDIETKGALPAAAALLVGLQYSSWYVYLHF